MILQKKSKRILMRLSAIGALTLISAFVLVGCEDAPSSTPEPLPLDGDNDMLIDIHNLDMLDHIRYNLAGTSYKTSETDSGVKCGANSATDCVGYELMRDLDFTAASSYANGRVNMAWRPTAGGRAVPPGSASNGGWQPIGNNATPFETLFEGNGRSISNLYMRNVQHVHDSRFGLFGQLHTGSTLRNLLIADSNLYGGASRDHVGIAVGVHGGTISNVIVRGGSVHGGNGSDEVGGLAGWSGGSIVASSASSVAVYGDDGEKDNVGGLVGQVAAGGTVTASYATGAVDGGTDTADSVGGFVGRNYGTIRASYATGNANANDGTLDGAGGFAGLQDGSAAIIASYATGNVDGGAGGGDRAGMLIGVTNGGTITKSYGFGAVSGGENPSNHGSVKPSGVTAANQLTAPVAENPPDTAAPAEWQDAASHTLNAWDFGTDTQNPALRYADYDGTSGTDNVDYCASFSKHIPGTNTPIVCGTTLLPGQDMLRSTTSYDLAVSASLSANTVSVNTSVTLTAFVHNRQSAPTPAATTLTYYRSTDSALRAPATDTAVGTDSIPILNGGATSRQDIPITTLATTGNYYYYACVAAVADEGDTTNNCSDVLLVRVTDAFSLVAGTQASAAFNFGIPLLRQDTTRNALITRPSALFTAGSALYMIANTRDRGGSRATQATSQQNVPEFYALDLSNGRADYSGAFIGSAAPNTPGVVPYGAAVIGNSLYFVGEKQQINDEGERQEGGGATGYLYRVPISSGRPNGLALEVGTLALSMSTTEDSPRGLAAVVTDSSSTLYLISANGMLHTIRTDTGQLTNSRMLQLGGSALPAADGLRFTSALTASSDGMLHAALMSGNGKNAELFSINPSTAVMTKVRDITLSIPGEGADRTTPSLTPTGLAYSGARLYLLAHGASSEVSSISASKGGTADVWLFVR